MNKTEIIVLIQEGVMTKTETIIHTIKALVIK